MLSMSNIRKSKSAAVSLFLIICMAAILLNIGFLTILNYKKSFNQSVDRLNSAHAAVVMLQSDYQDTYEDYFINYPGVSKVQKEEIIYFISSRFKFGTGETTMPSIFINADAKRDISYLSFVGEHKELGNTDIYVSYLLHSGGGYNLGDEFIINYGDKKYSFKIAGFTEDIVFGSTNVGCIGFYLPDISYQKFHKEMNPAGLVDGVLLQTRLTDVSKTSDMITDFQKNLLNKEKENLNCFFTTIQSAESARTSTADIGGAIIVCFSLIILLVSLIVIKFRIGSSIEEGITDIGALKAIGYISRQIKSAILLQFIIIALGGSLLGITISYLFVSPLGAMFCAQTGIIWKQGFDFIVSLFSLIILLLSVVIITTISTRRIKKLHPIMALRNGINTHSIKKNYFPLAGTGNLNILLALKSLFMNLKQNIMISIIVMAVSFASVFGIVLYYNIIVDDKAFIDMLGIEMCSISVTTIEGTDTEGMIKHIKDMKGVRKAVNYEYGKANINDVEVQNYVMKDFSMLDNNQVYEGRYPTYENEVAITGFVAKKFNKKVGNTIAIQMGGCTKDYIISGLFDCSSNTGRGIAMTIDGVRQMIPDYQSIGINIYLNDGIDAEQFNDNLLSTFSNELAGTMNMDMMAKSQLGVYKSIVAIFVYIILLITALVVILILYLVIKALIIRRRQEYGIQKAIGYTTYQLMTQMALSFLPIIIIGAVAGSIVGGTYMNSIIALMFRGIGVMKVDFFIPYNFIGLLCIGIGILSYAISMLVSLRIRKISAYGLIVDC